MKNSLLIMFAVALLAFAGCGGNHTPPATIDVGLARQSLEKALSVWKEKGDPKSLLEDKTSPMHFADEDWIMGYQLKGFQIVQEPMPMTDACVRFEVHLELTNPKGGSVQKKAQYSVTTSPSVSVVRAENNV